MTSSLSRAQSKEASRHRILEAALQCLQENGYAGTSTLGVQHRAGVSRGRVLHHFPTKESLLLAVVEYVTDNHREVRRRQLREAGRLLGQGSDRIDRAVELCWSGFGDPVYWAYTELWMASRCNPALQPATLEQARELGIFVNDYMASLFGEYAVHPHYSFVRDHLTTSMRGVALTYAFRKHRSPAQEPMLAEWKILARAFLDVDPAVAGPPLPALPTAGTPGRDPSIAPAPTPAEQSVVGGW